MVMPETLPARSIGAPPRVLVADPERDSRDSASAALEARKLEVWTVAGMTEAWKLATPGVTPEDLESDSVHAAGLVIRDLPLLESSWRANDSLRSFCRGRDRRDRGHRHAQAHPDPAREGRAGRLHRDRRKRRRRVAVRAAGEFPGLKGMDLAKVVSVRAPYQWKRAASAEGGRRCGRASACTSSPTTSASSATSCACSPTTAAT